MKDSQLYQFLCICSDNEKWKKRIEKRLTNPSPNQLFKSVEGAKEHYSKYDIRPLENEIILDSADDILIIMERIYEVLRFSSVI